LITFATGEQVTRLLDAARDVGDVVAANVGAGRITWDLGSHRETGFESSVPRNAVPRRRVSVLVRADFSVGGE
jgi:hypothetical protein